MANVKKEDVDVKTLYGNDCVSSSEDFKKLMSDFSTIKEYGNNLIYRMFDYYDLKFECNKRIK